MVLTMMANALNSQDESSVILYRLNGKATSQLLANLEYEFWVSGHPVWLDAADEQYQRHLRISGRGADQLPILFLATPITGLLVQPLIGNWSDNTWGPLGRWRPFFLVGAILSSCMLILMPMSSALWMAAGALWILDASINVSMEPFRAFVADMLPDEQRGAGFTMQSFFIGIGNIGAAAATGLMLRWLPASSGLKAAIPQWVRAAFWLGAAAFLGAVVWTIVTTKEYPPNDAERERLKTAKALDPGPFTVRLLKCPTLCGNWRRCSSAPGWDCSACFCILPWPWHAVFLEPLRRPTRPIPKALSGRATARDSIVPFARWFPHFCRGWLNELASAKRILSASWRVRWDLCLFR